MKIFKPQIVPSLIIKYNYNTFDTHIKLDYNIHFYINCMNQMN